MCQWDSIEPEASCTRCVSLVLHGGTNTIPFLSWSASAETSNLGSHDLCTALRVQSGCTDDRGTASTLRRMQQGDPSTCGWGHRTWGSRTHKPSWALLGDLPALERTHVYVLRSDRLRNVTQSLSSRINLNQLIILLLEVKFDSSRISHRFQRCDQY
jgi:hypothetical protein